MSEPEIYCPACAWRPSGEDLWMCTRNDCGTEWNTFWTRGVCPGCSYQWRNTQCLLCEEFSPHESWYHHRDPIDGKASEPAHATEA
jgi:hypothetical protein